MWFKGLENNTKKRAFNLSSAMAFPFGKINYRIGGKETLLPAMSR